MQRADAGYDIARLIDPVERALKHDRVTELARALAGLSASGALDDDRLFAPVHPEHYARRSIWRDPARSYVIIGMTWAPGQVAPLHDHCGLWGAEVVAAGTLKETTYRLLDRDGDGRHLFMHESDAVIRQGGVSTILPPLEYHAFGNAGATTAHTVHVYKGDLDRCSVFFSEGRGWWRACPAALRLDG